MRSLTKGIAQNLPVRFITFLGRKILRLDQLLNLINRQEYSSTLRTCILHIPLARPLFYLVYHLLLNAMIVKPRGHSLWLVKLPGGPAWLTPDLGDAIDHITVIWRRGIYDKYKPTKGQVVVDAGAHIGIYTVRVSKEVGNNGTILAIEPHPTNFECLQKSLGLNKCENVIPVNAAMASSCGEITLWLSDQSVGHSIKLRRSNSSLSVRSVTLDQLMEDFELTTIHLLKIDVEGATLDVLKGAEKTLRVHKPKIIAEIAHYPTEKEEVVHFLSDLEYNFSTEDEILYAEPRYNSF